jgi:CheY-like chemotaxis protein
MNARVLIIDDNPINLKLASDVLAGAGFEITQALDSEQAQRILIDLLPDLILMDVALPGMDALTLARKLKAEVRLRNVPIVALTDSAMRGDDRRAIEAVCSGYISKPVDAREFPRQMRAFLQPTHYPQQNHLLAALPAIDAERILPELELVQLQLGQVLYESGDRMRHVYFPTDAIVSLLYVMTDGASAEIAVVGNDGILGVALFMGGETTSSRAIVQSNGYAYRLPAQQIKDEFRRNDVMQILLLRYTQCLITQMAQTAVCNRHHAVDRQLCRWLLMSLDRLPSNELSMTQELIANMLGVRREGVNEAAGRLQKLGVILYSRGHITVLDRTRLEALCCECYAVVKKETDRLLPLTHEFRAY